MSEILEAVASGEIEKVKALLEDTPALADTALVFGERRLEHCDGSGRNL